MTRHIGNVARLFRSQTQPGLFAEFGFNQHSYCRSKSVSASRSSSAPASISAAGPYATHHGRIARLSGMTALVQAA
jgi:hypothetical protein